jgi:hypothetical protein
MRCPSCNFVHHAKTDVFGNHRKKKAGDDDGASCSDSDCRAGGRDYDAREIYGISATCPICLEECEDIVALPCGHVLCCADYRRMGGSVRGVRGGRGGGGDGGGGLARNLRTTREGGDDDDGDGGVLVHVRNAGQDGVNGTYRRHRGDPPGRYTSMGRYDGSDATYSIELRVSVVAGDDGARVWYLSCSRSEGDDDNDPSGRRQQRSRVVDFYRAKVGECSYPYRVTWEAATLLGTYPAPRVAVSHFTS